ncbi:GDSL esterase/lipase 1-like isoform X1 [Rosa rugosa]|uniref:GDSL esterase/lipase 1-like isoform X1 n=1 Tax=Rosa rugosa TaxID=74645 RepID=UPI002B405922|nr:GDSL esterase/lipase 1-like isoform X1 [Rosa rugosa]
MTTSRFQIYILAFYASLLVLKCSCLGNSVHQRKHAALFIFGDALFDNGNNNYLNTTTKYQSNFWPYGETFFNHSTGRFSDGRLISDFIAEYAKLPLIPPYLQPGSKDYTYGINFASSAAGALAETHPGFVIDLTTQLSYFKKVEKHLRHKLGDDNAHTLLSEAVYLISIGGNDYFAPFVKNSSFYETQSPEKFVGMVIGNLTNVIKGIYKKGGRKFGFANGIPLGCVPMMRATKPGNPGTCVDEITAVLKLHNKVLAKVLLKLKRQLHGFKYSNPNVYSYLDGIIKNPSQHGFKEGKVSCCGSGPYRGTMSCGGKRGVTEYQLCDNVNDYVFFDSAHPTDRANEQVSKYWWSHTTPNVKVPHVYLKELFEV